jgi:hypothetical protein
METVKAQKRENEAVQNIIVHTHYMLPTVYNVTLPRPHSCGSRLFEGHLLYYYISY